MMARNAKQVTKTAAVTITAHGEPIAVFINSSTRMELHAGETVTVETASIVIEPAQTLWRDGGK
jgi:D-alanyl-D-alanine carboxypeptidase